MAMRTENDDIMYGKKERFLDAFPLSEGELDRLLYLYECCRGRNPEASLSDLIRKVERGADPNASSEQQWLSELEDVEARIFPEAAEIFHNARTAASVVGCDQDESSVVYQEWEFLESIVSLVGRRGHRYLTHFIYDSVLSKMSSGVVDATSLVDFLYRLTLAALCLRGETTSMGGASKFVPTQNNMHPPEAWISSLRKFNKINADGGISRPEWVDWVTWTVPEAVISLSTFYHRAIFSPEHPFRSNSTGPFTLPEPDKQSTFWNHDNVLLPISLSCLSASMGGNWYRLYSSDYDGLSFLSFQNALLSYAGQTVVLIRTKKNDALFGFYTDCPWQAGSTWFGGDGFDSFLFRLDPCLQVYTPTYESKFYMYLNTATSPTNDVLEGLAIGGIAEDTPRVHIPKSLEFCKASPVDTTYSPGPLLGSDEEPFFDVDALEVWAVNVCEAEFLHQLEAGQRRMSAKEAARVRAAAVDPKEFISDFQSGTFINRLYEHREQARGRHDFVVAGEHHGYFVEGKRPSTKVIMTPTDSFADLSHSDEESCEKGG